MTSGNENTAGAGGDRVKVSDLRVIDQIEHAKRTVQAIECAIRGMEGEDVHKEAVITLIQMHEEQLQDALDKLEEGRS